MHPSASRIYRLGGLRPIASALAACAVVAVLLLTPAAASAADPLSMEARSLLQGHTRIGGWLGIEVTLANTGEPLKGELRVDAGTAGTTRYSTPVDLPSPARKTYTVYVQPAAGVGRLTLTLVSGGRSIAGREVAYEAVDARQLVVGVVAERPAPIVTGLRALSSEPLPPAIVQLAPSDLPDRVEAWSGLDRLVWQDVDSTSLRPEQLAALDGWLAGGGRLTILGGTAGVASLAGFSDAILPYRPTAVVDAAPAVLKPLLGSLPTGATTDLPALGGPPGHGRTLASVGGTVVAAEADHGSGGVTLVGFDPDAGWLARTDQVDALWRRLEPAGSGATGPLITGDDTSLVQALATLPALALPPLAGLILLLFGYILLVGPINYLVLRRLDRRDWAWVTIPALIVVFALGAYAYGASLRGGDLIVNQVALVRGGPDSDRGLAQVYVGLFSPSRATYQVSIPEGALVSAPTSEMSFGASQGRLDVIQGQPSRIRDLEVGFSTMRALRADAATAAPRIHAGLRLEAGTLRGTIRNDSGRTFAATAVVLGSSFALLSDLGAGETREVSLALSNGFPGMSLSDRMLGPIDYGSNASAEQRTAIVRHFLVDRLTMDPLMQGPPSGSLPTDGPVLLVWDTEPLLDLVVEAQQPRELGNVLYYIPLPLAVSGQMAFGPDLVHASVVASDAQSFGGDPTSGMKLGSGSVTVAYRPVGLSGPFDADRLLLALNGGRFDSINTVDIRPKTPAGTNGPGPPASAAPSSRADPLPPDVATGVPAVALFDRRADAWVDLPRLQSGVTYSVADPARYVDPDGGAVLVRFRDDSGGGIGVQALVGIQGVVR